jgi:hypothetical protein
MAGSDRFPSGITGPYSGWILAMPRKGSMPVTSGDVVDYGSSSTTKIPRRIFIAIQQRKRIQENRLQGFAGDKVRTVEARLKGGWNRCS